MRGVEEHSTRPLWLGTNSRAFDKGLRTSNRIKTRQMGAKQLVILFPMDVPDLFAVFVLRKSYMTMCHECPEVVDSKPSLDTHHHRPSLVFISLLAKKTDIQHQVVSFSRKQRRHELRKRSVFSLREAQS